MSETIRLFVGTDANNCDLESQCVLEYTARKHCSMPLDITWMRQAAKGPWSGWKCRSGRTPFSHFRWSPPAVCGYEGRSIYCDGDFFFLADLSAVWNQEIPNVALVRNPTGKLTSSFIVFDNAKAKGHVPSLDDLRRMPDAHSTLLNYFRAHPELLSATDGNWDCADMRGYELDDPTVKACHYTRVENQLHLKYAIPRLAAEGRSHWYTGPVFDHPRQDLVELFDRLYVEAQAEGFTVDKYRVDPFEGAARKDFTYSKHIGAAR